MRDEPQTGVKMLETVTYGLIRKQSTADYETFGLYQTPRDRRKERGRLDLIVLD